MCGLIMSHRQPRLHSGFFYGQQSQPLEVQLNDGLHEHRFTEDEVRRNVWLMRQPLTCLDARFPRTRSAKAASSPPFRRWSCRLTPLTLPWRGTLTRMQMRLVRL
jgi:hypothetical protein